MNINFKPKYRVNLSIDGEVVEFCRARGFNMSQEAENYFRGLMGMSSEQKLTKDHKQLIEDLEKQLATERAEQMREDLLKNRGLEEERKEEMKLELEFLKKLYESRKDGGVHAQKIFAERITKFGRDFKLDRGQVMDLVEGRRHLQ